MADSGPSWHEIADGEIDPFRDIDTECVCFRDRDWGEDYNRFAVSWRSFKSHVSHGLRFFEPKSEASFRQKLVLPLLELLSDLETVLQANQRLFRVTPLPPNGLTVPESPQEALAACGPAPWDKAVEGRMNPAGISYMYLSGDAATCLAEKRVGAGELRLLSEFVTTRDLKILDLSVLPAIRVKSMFDPEYDHDLAWAWGFARSFRDEISSPITETSEPAPHVPTQVLSEYLRLEGFEGIAYPSSQSPRGMNYVLFCGPKLPAEDFRPFHCPPAFSEWLRLDNLSRVHVLGLMPDYAVETTVAFGPDAFCAEAELTEEEEMQFHWRP